MTALPSKALLVVGLLLLSAEAWAQADRMLPADDMQAPPGQVPLAEQSPADSALEREAVPIQRVSPYPRRARQPHDMEKKIWSQRRRGPVDFLSLSMGGALLACILVVVFRRRKSAKAAAAEASEDLAPARVVSSNAKPPL